MLARLNRLAHTQNVPPLAIAAAITSAIVHASWNAALKGGRGDRIVDAFLIAVGGMMTALLLFVLMGAPAAASWPYLAASVAIHLVYWSLLFKAYDLGDLSHIYTLSRGTAPLLVAIGAMLAAHETPPPVKALGMVLVSIGVLGVGVSPNAPLSASMWAIVLGVSVAAYSLVDALGARLSGNPALYVGWTSGLMGAPMVAFCALRRGPMRLLKDAGVAPWRGIIIGVLSFAGYGLVLWAQTFAPIAQVTALRETSVVWGALIAFFVLHEDLGPRRWLGAIVVAAGAGLIAFA
jgi:drug/metabolite transporter (DMT)-like permease